ncbi:hypothetical protein [Streptomyces sp. NPDC047014]|uniref:hypothetical protein n=1 Tax=Streptomyces sp. NPDC047014 TaxID=3155736 RepID=UPI0033E0B6F4
MHPTPQPTLDEIEQRFTALLNGTLTRDEADRWAGRWVKDDTLDWDETSWWALGLLHGIDLRGDTPDTYLHEEAQLHDWLTELRHRRAG